MSEKNFYEEKLADIKKLIGEKNYEKAFEEIKVELNMPYIPAKYEPEFIKLHDLVRSQIVGKDKQAMTFTRAELMEMLLSDNEVLQSIALETIGEQNLHSEKALLQQRFFNWSAKDIVKKAFLFEILIEQKVDVEIEFKKGLKLNPAKSVSVLENKESESLFKEINRLTEREPSLTEAALQEARTLLLINYPEAPKDGLKLAKMLVHITKKLFGEAVVLSDEELAISESLNANNI